MKKIILGLLLCFAGSAFGMARLATRSFLMRNLTSAKTPVLQDSFKTLSEEVEELKEDLLKKNELIQRLEKQLEKNNSSENLRGNYSNLPVTISDEDWKSWENEQDTLKFW